MADLLSGKLFYPTEAPLIACRACRGGWFVWTKPEAVHALRQLMAMAGLPPEEFALHSSRIGGATQFSATGVPPEVLKKEGRWRSEACKSMCMRMAASMQSWYLQRWQTGAEVVADDQGMVQTDWHLESFRLLSVLAAMALPPRFVLGRGSSFSHWFCCLRAGFDLGVLAKVDDRCGA